jgi:hypothetical protein
MGGEIPPYPPALRITVVYDNAESGRLSWRPRRRQTA